jgi:hypothetical protein
MTRLRGVIFASAATMAPAALTAAGCSSSSPNSTTSGSEAGVEASVGTGEAGGAKGGTDAGSSDASLNLQWKVTVFNTPTPGVIGGDSGSGDAGAGDAGTTDATADGSADASDDGGIGAAPPLSGVQVCIYQNSAIPCVTSQDDGTFTLSGLPPRTDIALTFNKDGYLPALRPVQTASANMDGRDLPQQMIPASGSTPALGVSIDLQNKGQIQAFAVVLGNAVSDGGVGVASAPGTQVALSPMSGNGPYFLNNQNQFDLSATTFQGIVGNYYNVDPGTYTLTFTNPGFDCEPVSFPFSRDGWPLTTPAHSLKIVVAAGYTTGIVGTLCTKNAGVVAIDGG